MFVFGTAILLHGFGVNSSPAICETGIFLCLLLYMSTKILTYYFLVERAVSQLHPRHINSQLITRSTSLVAAESLA
jgi:hypothetical protein